MQNTDDRLNSALVASANSLLRHVVPLFRIQRGKRPTLVGTSLLVSAAGTNYLVSARHVLDHAEPPGILHYYVEQGKLHRLLGRVLRTEPPLGGTGPDRYDVSIVRLPQNAQAPAASVWKVAAPLSSLVSAKLPRTGKEYLVTGFPKSRSRADPHSQQLKSEASGFRVISASASQYESLGLSEESHIVMPLDIEKMRFPDGALRRIPDPHGMSGSPVWLLYDSQDSNDPTMTPVVGTVIEYHKSQKLLVATDVGVALHLINESAA